MIANSLIMFNGLEQSADNLVQRVSDSREERREVMTSQSFNVKKKPSHELLEY